MYATPASASPALLRRTVTLTERVMLTQEQTSLLLLPLHQRLPVGWDGISVNRVITVGKIRPLR